MGTNHRAEASRANGRNSQGPTSAEGKSRVRLNALKSGLFSRETVIPCAGESPADFNQLRDAVWEQFNPRDATTAMLADEVVNSYWRLLRARRCEAGEIRKRLETARYRLQFDRIARADSQKSSFIRHHIARYTYRTGGEQLDPAIIAASIEDARVQLKTSAAGLEFLTVMIRSVETAVKVLGYIEPKRVALLVDVCGIEDDFVKRCVMLNEIAEAEMAKIKKEKNADTTTFDLNKQMLLIAFKAEICKLMVMTKLLEHLESVEEEAQLASLLLPAPEGADRVHRAEAAHQRSFYRAMDRLMVI